jgi:hypothetical protein
MTAIQAMVERQPLATTAGDRPNGRRAQPVLPSSADGPIPGQNAAFERRNEQRALSGRAAR